LSGGVLPSAQSEQGLTSDTPEVSSGLEIRARGSSYSIARSMCACSLAWNGGDGRYKNYRKEDNGDTYTHADWGLQITLYLT
jgi:hypothetical protein